MGNEYQQEIDRIARTMHDAATAVLTKARASGHFPGEPGLTDEFGDPINPSIAQAEITLYEAFMKLREVRKLLFVEVLHEPIISI